MEISRALHGEREYAADTLQLLYVANRYEYRAAIQSAVDSGTVIVCDRYLASSIAYGEAQGLDPELAGGRPAIPAGAGSHDRPRHRP